MNLPERQPTAYAEGLYAPLRRAAEGVVPGQGDRITEALLPVVENYLAIAVQFSEELRHMADLSSRAGWQAAQELSEDWDALYQQLLEAERSLAALAGMNDIEGLHAKCEGVRVALDYMEAASRERDRRAMESGETDGQTLPVAGRPEGEAAG